MPQVEVNGLQFHYEDDDFSPPWRKPEVVYLQHGFSRSGETWRHWVPRLAGDFRVLRRDTRGHGQSQDPGPDYQFKIDDLLSDIVGFLDKLGLDKVHYVGESLGGTQGLAFAMRYPERLKTLTVIGAPTCQSPSMKRIQPMGYKDWPTALATLGSHGYAKAMYEKGAYAGYKETPQDRFIIDIRSRTPDHIAVALARMVQSLEDIMPALHTIKVPTLVIAPTDSAYVPLAHQVGIRDAIPGARILTVEGPHASYNVDPDGCVAAIKKFIARNTATAA